MVTSPESSFTAEQSQACGEGARVDDGQRTHEPWPGPQAPRPMQGILLFGVDALRARRRGALQSRGARPDSLDELISRLRRVWGGGWRFVEANARGD